MRPCGSEAAAAERRISPRRGGNPPPARSPKGCSRSKAFPRLRRGKSFAPLATESPFRGSQLLAEQTELRSVCDARAAFGGSRWLKGRGPEALFPRGPFRGPESGGEFTEGEEGAKPPNKISAERRPKAEARIKFKSAEPPAPLGDPGPKAPVDRPRRGLTSAERSSAGGFAKQIRRFAEGESPPRPKAEAEFRQFIAGSMFCPILIPNLIELNRKLPPNLPD